MSNRQRDNDIANDNRCAILEIAMSSPPKVKFLTFALHPILEHPYQHIPTPDMNDITTIGVIFVIICTVLALAAVVWALSDGEICRRRRRRSEDDVERSPRSVPLPEMNMGNGAAKKKGEKSVRFQTEPMIIPNSRGRGEDGMDSVRSQYGGSA